MRERYYLSPARLLGAIFLKFFEKLGRAGQLLENRSALAAKTIRVGEVVIRKMWTGGFGIPGAKTPQAP